LISFVLKLTCQKLSNVSRKLETQTKRWEKWLFWFCFWAGFEGGGKGKCVQCGRHGILFFCAVGVFYFFLDAFACLLKAVSSSSLILKKCSIKAVQFNISSALKWLQLTHKYTNLDKVFQKLTY